jgi:very-short-patch-repair endonuclease
VRTKLRTQRARALRNNTTLTERRLWAHLRGRKLEGFKFRRQHPIGEYIVDFYCPAAHLVIELDGYTHTFEKQVDYDEARDRWLKSQGCNVLRFSADYEEHEFMERVVATIYQALTEVPTSGPPPARKGRDLINARLPTDVGR